MASEHVWWNPERARDILEKILQDVQELTLRHLAQKPAYPVGAAGQGFSHLGERIADSLTQLHHRGERRAGSLADAIQDAIREVERLNSAEHSNAEELEYHR